MTVKCLIPKLAEFFQKYPQSNTLFKFGGKVDTDMARYLKGLNYIKTQTEKNKPLVAPKLARRNGAL